MKILFITFFLLLFFNVKSQILTDGEHKIALYACLDNGKVVNSAKPTSSRSYIYVNNASNIIAIFLDGILIEAIKYNEDAIKKNNGSFTFQAKSINDLINRECIIDITPEGTPGFVNFAISRGNGSFDMYSIKK